MPTPRAALLAHLDAERAHVLAAVEGLTADQLEQVVVPSRWSMERLLSHLLWDDEVFWIGAVLAGDRQSIADVRDGWSSLDPSGPDLIERYRATIAQNNAIIAERDLDAPPAWWPPPEVFPGRVFESGWQVLHRVLGETATHAGHLDIARELIDGRQHLVVG